MRALREAFAFFIELTQNVQSRSLLGERPLKDGKILFRFGKQLFFFLQASLDIDRFVSVCFQRGSNLPEQFIAPTAQRLNLFRKLFDLYARRFATRFRAGKFSLECRDFAFGFGKYELQLLPPRAALSPAFLHFAGLFAEPGQLALFFLQMSLDFCDRVVCLLDLSSVVVAFFFSVCDVASRALD